MQRGDGRRDVLDGHPLQLAAGLERLSAEKDRDGHILRAVEPVAAVVSAMVGGENDRVFVPEAVDDLADAVAGGVDRAEIFIAQPAVCMAGCVRPAEVEEGEIDSARPDSHTLAVSQSCAPVCS